MKQLRFTTTYPVSIFNLSEYKILVDIFDDGELILDHIKAESVYIHGKAEALVGFDIPYFIDGNMSQLENPIEQQDILMILPSGTFKCKAEYIDKPGTRNSILITLMDEPSIYNK